MRVRRFFLLFVLALAARADGPTDAAIKQYASGDFDGARRALEAIVRAQPANAAACHALGMALRRGWGAPAREAAAPWLEKAVTLEPGNSDYLGDFGANCLEVADHQRSLSLALRGRDSLEKALALNPGDLGAADALIHYYTEAPWPLGNPARAEALVKDLTRRDARRGVLIQIYQLRRAGSAAAALALAKSAAQHYPNDYAVLFEFGRLAAQGANGADAADGAAALQHCLELVAAEDYPGPPGVEDRLGELWERQGQRASARAAYQRAAELDPRDETALHALDRLR